ncbi:hypothetical protein E4T50_11612 [Aureobasidium sp. EXF-12298]|nr:hypothetical protein E4T50_11612 [Aureobasidium sp. EXF-12298]KAI4760223.1 hypothetical protein E4T51_06776 [Aureobasidium sp. EXF-12344]KAI4772422.1 hypothetical protein E4T52_12594 [Aureobasidium sp. EXF-3400]
MACTLSYTTPQQHSLMGLPRELRDMVYTNVFSSGSSKSGSIARQHELHCHIELPLIIHLSVISFDWLDLMRTNGQIADEMRQLYHMPSSHTSTTRQTWSMQLNLNNDEYTLINLTLSMFGHWDNDRKDKPGSLFEALSELRGQITHHGPNIAVSEALQHPIVFDTLRLNISFADEEKPYLIPSGPESIYILGYGKSRIYNRLIEDMVTAAGNHVWEDNVKNVKIQGPKSLGLPKTDITMS